MIEAGNIDFIFGLIVGIVTGAALWLFIKHLVQSPPRLSLKNSK